MFHHPLWDFFLVDVLYVYGKNMYFWTLGYSIWCMSLRLHLLSCLNLSYPYQFLSVFVYKLLRQMCTNLPQGCYEFVYFFLCSSVSFCFIYFEAILLDASNLILYHVRKFTFFFIVKWTLFLILFALRSILSHLNKIIPAFFLIYLLSFFSFQQLSVFMFRSWSCKYHIVFF